MAAEVLAGAGHVVTVYERMGRVGRKFLLAGRGGLNLTHSEPLERFVGRYGAAAGVMGGMVGRFGPEALRAWCEGLGEATFVGSSGRVFPASFKASPLLRAWLRRLEALGVRVRTGHRWVGWATEGLRFATPAGEAVVRADAAVLALGGASWPRMGSDGAWVPAFGAADVAALRPANCGFRCDWSAVFRDRFAGAPLKRVAASFGGAVVRGEAVVTAEGIEGGVVYALSGALRDEVAARGVATLLLDLRPDLDVGALTARLGGPGVSMSNALRRAGLDPAAAGLVREVGGEGTLAARVKGVALRLTGTSGIDRAISTAGGVRWDALDGLMVRGRPGVFVAGEMLDWEAPTGGYLLQGCFSTGVAAGRAASSWLSSSASTAGTA